MPPQSNDHLSLTPRTEFEVPTLEFDFPGLQIGVAEYEAGPTGCTVFRFPGGAMTAIDVRGGMVGITAEYDFCHAICLAGGSLLGLEAAAGVTVGLFAEQKYSFDKGFPLVNGAIIYDYGPRKNMIYPDNALGRAALKAAKPGVFALGARGAGRSAGVGSMIDDDRAEPSGQGGAYREVAGIKLAVFSVVNATGVILNREGEVVRGNLNSATGQRARPLDELEVKYADPPQGRNTTLTVLVTDAKLDSHSLTQLGRQVHSSMARAICPFHTEWDGDVLYTVTTAKTDSTISSAALGMIASEVAWDAVLSAVGQ